VKCEGKTFTIIANNNSDENIYIQSMKLNDKVLKRYWISHDEIIKGGKLELTMGNEYAKNNYELQITNF